MASKHVETFKSAHEAFNQRKFDAVLNLMTDDIVFEDYPRGATHHGKKGFREFMDAWVKGFSNAKITDAKYYDAGDTVIAEYIGRGTNDGPLGSMPKTGKPVQVRMCEIVRFDASGKIASGRAYYDQVTMLNQLGHMTPVGATH